MILELGENKYTTREPVTMGMVTDIQVFGEALGKAEEKWKDSLEDADHEKYHSIWLKLCRAVFVEDVSALAMDKIEITESIRLQGFFASLGAELTKSLNGSDKSSPDTEASTKESSKVSQVSRKVTT